MTTIVYSHEERRIACDSRVVRGSQIMSDSAIKWIYKGADLLFFAGTICDAEVFLEHYGEAGKKPDSIVDLDALLIRNGVVYECSFSKDSGYWELPLRYSSALGSGSSFALAALDFSLGVEDAVNYAKKKDIYTGGEIHVFDLDTMRFL